MDKPTTAGTTGAGSTGLGRIRSALAFRHENPLARLVSTVLAFAIATLLVVGGGAAYADDTTPAPSDGATAASTDGTEPSSDATDPVAPDTSAPAESDPAAPDASAPGTGTSSGDSTGSGGKTTTVVRKTSSPITSALQVLSSAITVNCVNGVGTVVGGFEIDGDTCVDNNADEDWDSPVGASMPDGLGDATTFHGGTAEGDDPAGWTLGGPAPNGKTDIETAWAYSKAINGTVYGYFAITNASDTGGTSQYDVEYNQLDPTAGGMPNRSAGDLLFRFNSTGSNAIQFTDAKQWTLKSGSGWSAATCQSITTTAGWCTIPIPANAFDKQVNSDGTFFEGAINIGLFFGNGTCSGNFGTVNIRSVTGNAFYSSTLKDYVTPLSVDTPSTCGKIIIDKTDENGQPLAGATFSISPNPDPTKANNVPFSVTDNDANDKDPADGVIEISPVDPGDSYTVTETASPTGYMIDNPLGTSTNPQTVGASQTKTFDFVDHRIWKGLSATKSADPTYRATYHWSVDKEISPNGTSGWTTSTTSGTPLVKNTAPNAANADKLFYRVTVTEGPRDTDRYKVSGTIHVTNPSDNVGSMDAVVTDTLPGATCLVDGGASTSITVAKGGSVDVPYVCSFAGTPTAGQLAGTNTAKVEWDRSTYPQVPGDLTDVGGSTRKVEPTATYDFANAAVTDVDKTVTVTDDQHTFSPAFGPFTWSAQGTAHTSDVYSQTLTVTPGSCSATFANTATITGSTSGVLGSDSAYGKVCEGADLTITRLDARGFTRTYPWSIEKATTTPKIVSTDGTATGSYDVTVTAGDGVDGPTWSMTGTITVHNPNSWEAVSVTSLPVTYSGGGTCAVTGESFPVSIPAGGQHGFAYSCDFGGVKPSYSGDITARANWSAAAAYTTNDHVTDVLSITEADWSKTLVNDTVTVVDDNATPGDTSDDTEWTLDWATVYALTDHQKVLHYTIDLPVPDGGSCAVSTNTVKVLGDGDVVLDADGDEENNSADVQVCNPVGLSVTKTAVGDFTRTYLWSLEKFIDGDQSSQTVHIDTYDHTFDYKVVVTPGAAVDSAWKVSGTITVTNDNTDSDIDPIQLTGVSDLPDIGSTGSCTYQAPLFPASIASNGHLDVPYECTFAQQPTKPYAGTNTASATWGQTGSASSAAVPVTWNDPTEVDKSLDVWDDKVNLDDAVKLGTADWNADGTPTLFTYSKNLTVPESTQGSCAPPQTNTAWLGGDGSEPTDLQDSTDAIICVNAGTWEVSKVNVDGDGPVPTDSDVTYRLTAHKTGGANPKDVTVYDDLADIAPYVSLPTLADLQAAAPAGTTVELTGTLVTWTIAELGASDESLEFTVHVNADAYGVDLPNLVTSPGSDNCPDAETASTVDECTTDNDTPHYTLAKTSDAGAQVMPPYLGDQGTLITYTLTVHNDSDAPIDSATMPGEKVTDDLSDVLDNAAWVGNLTPDGQAEFDGDHTLTWTLPEIAAGDTATLTYQVRVAGDQWDQTLTNVAHEGPGGDCLTSEVVLLAVVDANCTTTTVTPPYALVEALKVDADTQQPLAGAEFTLSRGEQVLETGVVSDADGVARFTSKLQPGTFQVTETTAPTGYSLPAEPTQEVIVTEADLDNGDVPVSVTFADPPIGDLTLSKAHFERNATGTGWVPSDGSIDFGDTVRYVMTVTATGTKVFHDVTLTDYVPGYNPADAHTQLGGFKASLVSGSIACSGAITCTSTYNSSTGLVTWHLGDVGDESGTVEFVVRMPDLPRISPLAAPGVAFAGLMWNQAYLSWTQADDAEGAPPHSLSSNEVTDAANEVLPPKLTPPKVKPPAALPNTGGPDSWLLTAGLLLLLGGGLLLAGDRLRRIRG